MCMFGVEREKVHEGWIWRHYFGLGDTIRNELVAHVAVTRLAISSWLGLRLRMVWV